MEPAACIRLALVASVFVSVTTEAVAVLTALEWNVHFQCGSEAGCRENATAKFVGLTSHVHANVALAIELEANSVTPVDLPAKGLQGWTQVSGSCNQSKGDALALAFAPTFVVHAQGGGCLSSSDSRAFAVASVTPPFAVGGCSNLCVIGLHAPHGHITQGQSTVASICSGAESKCAVILGDWNDALGPDVDGLLGDLVGSSSSSAAAPNERTCCFPESRYLGGAFDHVVTNVPGAVVAGSTVFPYQIASFDTEEHKPIAVNVSFPAELII